ncbi:hypothetical protein HJC23_002440 [Cyclotella cryptica]|uniref:Uncharacterized protein n=1 Tax=Cyclotella cryptica TaxID=29204 RepID=A0ABD3PVX2_9STRA
MMTGAVPVPARVRVPKVPSLLDHRASHERARGVDGMTTTAMIGKAGKAGEALDIARKRKIAVGAEHWHGRDLTLGMGNTLNEVEGIEEDAANEYLGN